MRCANRIMAVVAAVAGLLLGTHAAHGGHASIQIDTAKERSGFLSENTFRRLETIQAIIERGELDRAEEGFERLLRLRLEPFERAVVLRAYASILLGRDELTKGRELLEQVLELDQLSLDETISLLYVVAQLYASQEDYAETIGYLDLWRPLAKEVPTEAHMLAAASYSELSRFSEAEREVRAAIAKAPEVKEQWYQLLLALIVEQSKNADAITTLMEMIRLWPDRPDYPKQLASLYASQEQEAEAVAVFELALAAGHLQAEKEILQLVGLYLFLEIPHKGALLLERSLQDGTVATTMANYETLGNAWLRAQEPEKAVEAYRKATAIEPNAKSDMLAAQLLMDLERWADAIAVLTHITKDPEFASKLADPGRVFLLLGSANYEARQLDAAREAFEQGREFAAVKDDCELWIAAIDSEIEAQKNEAEARED